MLTAEALDTVEAWMTGAKLQLAHHKTEVVLVSNRKAVQSVNINVGEYKIASKRALKHLGVMVDDRLNFNAHVDYACERASIMPNVGGLRSSKRRLLASVATSTLRYAVPAWAAALKTQCNRGKLNRVFRLIAMSQAPIVRFHRRQYALSLG